MRCVGLFSYKLFSISKIMDEVKEGIQYAFQTKNEWTFAISGTGKSKNKNNLKN